MAEQEGREGGGAGRTEVIRHRHAGGGEKMMKE